MEAMYSPAGDGDSFPGNVEQIRKRGPFLRAKRHQAAEQATVHTPLAEA